MCPEYPNSEHVFQFLGLIFLLKYPDSEFLIGSWFGKSGEFSSWCGYVWWRMRDASSLGKKGRFSPIIIIFACATVRIMFGSNIFWSSLFLCSLCFFLININVYLLYVSSFYIVDWSTQGLVTFLNLQLLQMLKGKKGLQLILYVQQHGLPNFSGYMVTVIISFDGCVSTVQPGTRLFELFSNVTDEGIRSYYTFF